MSKEELQATNEELRTVNQELQGKVAAALETSADLQNLVNATAIATLFLDRSMRIRMFTPATRSLFNLIATDYGRPFADFTHELLDVDVPATAARVLATLQAVEQEVRTRDDRTYVLRIVPYRESEDRIGGVVLTFFDITARKRAEEALRASEEKFRALFTSIDDGLCIMEVVTNEHGDVVDLYFRAVNAAFAQHTGLVNVVDKTTSETLPNFADYWLAMYQRAYATGEPLSTENYVADVDRWYRVKYLRIGGPGSPYISVVFEDISERKRAEERQTYVLQLSDTLRSISNAVDIQATVTQTAMAYFNADRCYYCEIEQGNAIILRDAARQGLPSIAGVYALSSMPIFQAVVDAGRPFLVHDVYTTDVMDEQLKELYIQRHIRDRVSTRQWYNSSGPHPARYI